MTKRELCGAVLILWIAALLRIIALSQTTLAHDEMLTYERTQGSLHDRLDSIAAPGNHVPLFFLLTGVLPHDNELELRLGAVWFSLLSIALMMAVARRTNPKTVLWIGLFLACTPFMVRYGRYARPYPMFLFFSLLANIFFLRVLDKNKGWLGFFLSSLITYSTHLGGAALPISQFVILLWKRPSRAVWVNWFIVQALVSLPVFIWMAFYANIGGSQMLWIDPPNIGRPYYTIMHLLIGYAFPPDWYFILLLPVISLGLGAGMWTAYREKRTSEVYWLVLSLLPLLLVFLISQVKPVYDERYFTAAIPGLCLLTFQGWERLRILKPAMLYAVVFVTTITLSQLFTTHYERYDWRDSVAYVRSNLQNGDGIMLDAANWIVFGFYYPEAQNVLHPDAAEQIYAGACCEAEYQRLWVFVDNKPDADFLKWINEQEIIEERDYLDMRVYLITNLSPSSP